MVGALLHRWQCLKKDNKKQGKREAIEFAKTFYDTVTVNHRQGLLVTTAMNFGMITKATLKEEKGKFDRGELTKITYDNTVYRYDKHVLPYFRDKDISKIDYSVMADYLQHMSQQKISANTIRAYMQLVHKVLSHAARRKIIANIPEFPPVKVKVKDMPRGWFTTSEYQKLCQTASSLITRPCLP